MELESENNDKHIMRNALIFSITIMLGVGGYFYYTNVFHKEVQNLIEIEPQKTEYGTVAPQDFPQDFLSEVNTPLEQSYVLEYPGQRQSTIVFVSEKSITDIQKIYTDYFVNNQWVIMNNSVDIDSVAFYAKKGTDEINLVVSRRDAVTQVSMSVVKPTN